MAPAGDPVAPRTNDPHQSVELPHPVDTVSRWPDDWIPVGTGLIGSGACAAARTLLLDVLTANRRADPAGAGRVIVTTAALTLLLPGDPLAAHDVPGLTITDDLTAALDRLDQEILTRSRSTNDDATTPADDTDPDGGNGASPPLLAIVEPPPPAERVRLGAILLQGASLGIDAVILGRWPSGHTLTVDHDGHATPADDSGPGAARQPAGHRRRHGPNPPAVTRIRPTAQRPTARRIRPHPTRLP